MSIEAMSVLVLRHVGSVPFEKQTHCKAGCAISHAKSQFSESDGNCNARQTPMSAMKVYTRKPAHDSWDAAYACGRSGDAILWTDSSAACPVR